MASTAGQEPEWVCADLYNHLKLLHANTEDRRRPKFDLLSLSKSENRNFHVVVAMRQYDFNTLQLPAEHLSIISR